MPLPKPGKGEDQQTFVSRCIKAAMDDNTFENNTKGRQQAAAACYSNWRDAHGGKPPSKVAVATTTKQCTPGDDETEEEFMDRCQDEHGLDEDVCQTMW